MPGELFAQAGNLKLTFLLALEGFSLCLQALDLFLIILPIMLAGFPLG